MKSDFWKPWKYEEFYSPYQTRPINILSDTSKIEDDSVHYNININIKDEINDNTRSRFDSPTKENTLLQKIYENSLKLSQNINKLDLRADKEKSFPTVEKEKELPPNKSKKPPKLNKKQKAAIIIQKNWKTFLTRQKYLEFRRRWIIFRFCNTFQTYKKAYIKKYASKILLKHFKNFSSRMQLRKKLLLEKFESHCALLIQRNYRLFRLRKKIASKPPLPLKSLIHREFSEFPINSDNNTTIKKERKEEEPLKNEKIQKKEKLEKQENMNFEPRKKPPLDPTNKWDERENMAVGGANKKRGRENFSPSDFGDSPFASKKKEVSPKKEISQTPKPFLKKGQRNINMKKTPIKQRNKEEDEEEENPQFIGKEESFKKDANKNNSNKKLSPKVSKSPKIIGRKGEVDKRDFLKKKNNSIKNGEKINMDGIGVKVDCWLHKPTSQSQSHNDERNMNNNNTTISQNNNYLNANVLNNQNNNHKNGLVQQRVSYWQLDTEQDKSLRFIKNIANIEKNDDGVVLVGSGPKFTESSHDGGEGAGVEDLERAYRTNYFSKMTSKYLFFC